MQIAIDITALPHQSDPAVRHYLLTLFRHWTAVSGHSFLFIRQKNDSTLFNNDTNNCSWQDAPAPGKTIASQYWQRVRLPVILKKKNIELLVKAGGIQMSPQGIPTVLLVYGNDLLRGNDKVFARSLHQAARILVFTEKDTDQLSRDYRIPKEKITVLKTAAAYPVIPLDFEEKISLKKQYTDGKEFFMYSGIIGARQNLTNLLRAFSVFKKRQGTATRLLLEGPLSHHDKIFTDSLTHYKYREELVLTGELPPAERAALIASAYALVDPAIRPHAAIPILEAAAAAVPAIATEGQPVLETGAYLSADMTDYVDLASGMMQLYKDEGLRNQLIQKVRTADSSSRLENAKAAFIEIMQPLLR